jgi:hypothetical protein
MSADGTAQREIEDRIRIARGERAVFAFEQVGLPVDADLSSVGVDDEGRIEWPVRLARVAFHEAADDGDAGLGGETAQCARGLSVGRFGQGQDLRA